jgi:hypothetical protein
MMSALFNILTLCILANPLMILADEVQKKDPVVRKRQEKFTTPFGEIEDLAMFDNISDEENGRFLPMSMDYGFSYRYFGKAGKSAKSGGYDYSGYYYGKAGKAAKSGGYYYDGSVGDYYYSGPEYYGKAGKAAKSGGYYYGSVGDYYYSGPEYYGKAGKAAKSGGYYYGSVGDYYYSGPEYYGKAGKAAKSGGYDYGYSGHYHGYRHHHHHHFIRGPDEYDGKIAVRQAERREGYYDDCRRDKKNAVVFNNVIY